MCTCVNQGHVWQSTIVARALPCSTNSLRKRFFASFEISKKYSSGKEKSHLRMFVVVSSTESSKNGDTPLRNTYNRMPKHQQSVHVPVAWPITISGAENSKFDGGRIMFRLRAPNASPKSINFNCWYWIDDVAAAVVAVDASILVDGPTNRFSGLMSKWATFRLCNQFKASHNWRI